MKTIFLILSLSLVTSCAHKVPITAFYPMDVKHKICSKREIVNYETLETKNVGESPLISCDGFIAIHYNEFLALKDYLIKAQNKMTGADIQRVNEITEGL